VLRTILRWIYHRLPQPSTNYLYRRFDKSPFDGLPTNAVIYDIGSKHARARYAFGSPPPDAKVTCVDLFPAPGVDIVADAHDLHMIQSESADCVLCVGVLLHCRCPKRVMSELRRILKPGGTLYISVPFIFTTCEDPYDYWRYTKNGLEIVCEGVAKVESGFNRGPASTMCHLLVEFCAIALCFGQEWLYTINLFCFRWLLFPMKYLDAIIARYPRAKMLYSGVYFLGRKPA
jgi:SAM-dependent methyltransferase